MKKWYKKSLIICISILVLIMVLAVFTLDQVDTTPYFETNYYRQTKEQIDDLILESKITTGKLKAGFSRVNITPEISVIESRGTSGGGIDEKL
ncbi:MAG: hypothetical protein KDC53_14425 [Saprospiraceae bacterium]|nr:hypothetical protein [Saprospiraceae bacterium]